MMTFDEAMKCVNDGKRVKRLLWRDEFYIDKKNGVVYSRDMYGAHPYKAVATDREATDWRCC